MLWNLSVIFHLAGMLAMTLNCTGAPATPLRDCYADTWVATDALGRELPTCETTGPPRPGKQVAVFCFLWMGAHTKTGPHDVSKILAQYPEAMQDKNHPAWGPLREYHHWGEPLFGYYLSTDKWVHRRHAQMLVDAGVDAVIFDASNTFTYRESYTSLGEAWMEMRRMGCPTPQFAFLTPFGNSRETARQLYEELYKPGLFKELWYCVDGKPLILARRDEVEEDIHAFFTVRNAQPSYFDGCREKDTWSWLEVYPQNAFINSRGEVEQASVGVAQNARADFRGPVAFNEPGTMGRSWHSGGKDPAPDAVLRGPNFAEQWKRALEIDPRLLFITGWNEWIAMRLDMFNKVSLPVMFVDQFSQEYSRDIEPMRGGHGDNYYYQMIDGIRRFKGVRPVPEAGPAATIRLDRNFSQWNDVTPEYRDHVGDTMHRDEPGLGNAGRYVDRTGRNDIVVAKVARDERNLSFYVRTKDPITSHTDPHWMMLLLGTGTNGKRSWEAYDYVVNRTVKDSTTTLLERSKGGWNWETVAEVPYRVSGCEMQLCIPRSALGVSDAGKPLQFDFKWCDNMQHPGDVMDFHLHGDAAPSGRFAYRYRTRD